MKFTVIDYSGKKVKEQEIKIEAVSREDIFKRAVLAEQSWWKQSHGSDPEAGKKNAINLRKRRSRYRSIYGKGASRMPRKVTMRRGMQLGFVGAFAPGTRGGRKAHPPKAEKKAVKQINTQEYSRALLSGFVASCTGSMVAANGPKVPEQYPFVFDTSCYKINKTKDFTELLVRIGFSDELARIQKRKVRAGKGKMRNRKYHTKVRPLLICAGTAQEAAMIKAAGNVIDVMPFEMLVPSMLGMGVQPGRCVVFTQEAFEYFYEMLK